MTSPLLRVIHPARGLVVLVAMLVASLLGGCGGSREGGSDGAIVAKAALEQPATLQVNFQPQSPGVTQSIVVGVDSQGKVQLGPSAAPWSPSRTIYPMPLTVSAVLVMTASDTAVVHAFSKAVAPTPGGLIVINEPESGSVIGSLTVEPQAAVIAQGTTQAYRALARFSDDRIYDVTQFTDFTTSNPSVATVSNEGAAKGVASGLAPGTATIGGGFAGATADSTLRVTAARLLGVTVSPPRAATVVGYPRVLHATAVFSDNTAQDVTQLASWSSSDPAVAAVSDEFGKKGTVLGVAAGRAPVSATVLGQTATSDVFVHAASLISITVTPPLLDLAKGEQTQLSAVALFADQTTLDVTPYMTWTSSDDSVCAVSNATGSVGLATGVGVGTTTVTASYGGVRGTATVRVTAPTLTSIVVTPALSRTPAGLTVHYTATGIFSDDTVMDLTESLAWSSSDPTVAALSNEIGDRGVARTLAPGATVVTAEDPETGVFGTASLTVTTPVLTALAVTPQNATSAAGFTVPFKATGTYSDGTLQDLTERVTWTSTRPDVAAISDQPAGLAIALTEGTTIVRATDPLTALSASTPFTVTSAVLQALDIAPRAVSTAAGTQVQYSATGLFSDGSVRELTTQVTWESSSPEVAPISSRILPGLATGLTPGVTTITAFDPDSGTSATTPLTVTQAVPVSLVIEPAPVTLARGRSTALSALVTFSDHRVQDVTESATWRSSAPDICVVANVTSHRGTVLALNSGTATVSATYEGLHDTCPVTVTPAVLVSVTVTPHDPFSPVGVEVPLTAVGTYSDTTTQDLTQTVIWNSQAPIIATVSNEAGSQGMATPLRAGATIVTATDPGSGIQGTATLTVTPAVLTRLDVSPVGASTAVGAWVDYVALGTYSDGTVHDLTGTAFWSASDTRVATVSNGGDGPSGRAYGRSAGTATVTATTISRRNPLSAGQVLTVTPPRLESIVITPVNPTMQAGTFRQFTAMGLYSDNTTQDLTTQVAWTSSVTGVAHVVPGGVHAGLVNARVTGQTVLGVVDDDTGVAASTTVTVSGPYAIALEIRPLDEIVPTRFVLQYEATATWSDGTRSDVTAIVTWHSSNPSVASINPSTGEAQSSDLTGATTITAVLLGSGLRASTTLTVSPTPTVVSLAVVPAYQEMVVGDVGQVNAIGTLSDGSTVDLTSTVTWTVGQAKGIEVSNSPGLWGQVTALKPGQSTAEAAYVEGGVSLHASGKVQVAPK